ncbi:unnamed protein product, partial [Ceratitis capitata]
MQALQKYLLHLAAPTLGDHAPIAPTVATNKNKAQSASTSPLHPKISEVEPLQQHN